MARSAFQYMLKFCRFNYIGSEGSVTETGCRPASNTCGSAGQDAINHADWLVTTSRAMNLADRSGALMVTPDQVRIRSR